jgi:hypothetical protein
VIALSVGGKNNKVFKSQDIVNENNFSSSVDELVAKGFLEEIEPLKVELTGNIEDKVEVEETATESSSILDELTSSNESENSIDMDDYSKKDIESALKELDIEYKSRESKTFLWNLLMENENAVHVLMSI